MMVKVQSPEHYLLLFCAHSFIQEMFTNNFILVLGIRDIEECGLLDERESLVNNQYRWKCKGTNSGFISFLVRKRRVSSSALPCTELRDLDLPFLPP